MTSIAALFDVAALRAEEFPATTGFAYLDAASTSSTISPATGANQRRRDTSVMPAGS